MGVVGTAISTLTPTAPAGAGSSTSYTASPTLPSGLSISYTTGVISGTPSSASSMMPFTITASNGPTVLGTATVMISITTSGGGGGGGSFSYTPTSPIMGIVGTAITALMPTAPAGAGPSTTYAASPTLPSGLSISYTTGVISGTPSSASSMMPFTITASNGPTVLG
ncbi:MAG: putative Ig domain-containing protein, partial [Bacteroidetes bacterium]|nr:putative Ig domain-containing protein [Bacteroidota bacterium]